MRLCSLAELLSQGQNQIASYIVIHMSSITLFCYWLIETLSPISQLVKRSNGELDNKEGLIGQLTIYI